MTTKFESLTEKQKVYIAYWHALQHAQEFLDEILHITGFENYKNELKVTIEWLQKKLRLVGLKLY